MSHQVEMLTFINVKVLCFLSLLQKNVAVVDLANFKHPCELNVLTVLHVVKLKDYSHGIMMTVNNYT